MKKCRVCKENKPLSEFYKKKYGKYGVGTRCKSCKQDYDREYNSRTKSRELKRAYNAKDENIARRNEYRNRRYRHDEEYRKK